MPKYTDIAVIGAGAAGLMTGIWAGRTHPHRSILLLDGAHELGQKILASGGGRCNVTHDQVDAQAYAGSSPNAIQKVLRRFDAPHTIAFFRELGVELKREENGKFFPVTDSARTVLNALLMAARQAKVILYHPRRVAAVERVGNGFHILGAWGEIHASHLVLATGGRSLPESGSDGHGYKIAQSLGHQITARIFPALVPLTLPRDHFLCSLSGIAVPATLDLWSQSGKRLSSFTNSTLCTHYGLSGPSVLDISRYYIDAKFEDPGATMTINWLPGKAMEQLDGELQALGSATPLRYLREYLPERLVRALCEQVPVEPSTPGHQMTRSKRKAMARVVTQMPLPITGHRGYHFAEATGGGIPLTELYLDSMESRVCPGLHFCGEICDVDGRIGGFNFQWAWASGYTAGVSVGG